jgi:hypothetical protein
MQAPRTTTPWAEEVKEHFSGPVHVSKDLAEFSGGILWRNSSAGSAPRTRCSTK